MFALRRVSDLPSAVRARPHDPDYLAFRSYRIPSPRVVDVGANRGQAIASFQRTLKKPFIRAFEPDPWLAAHTATRFASHRVIVEACGLGAVSAHTRLFVPWYGHARWDSRSTLQEELAWSALDPGMFWRFDETRLWVEMVDVEIRTLDEFDLDVHILKVDVEGAEDAVIEGAMNTIGNHLPVIMAEGALDGTRKRLGTLGYRPYRFDVQGRRFIAGLTGEVNTFFLLQRHHALFRGG